MSDRVWHVRHDDFEVFDRITLEVEPRWKESDMSGDEWRVSVKVCFWFKGQLVWEDYRRDMESAILLLGHDFRLCSSPIADKIIEMEQEGYCDQPSCRQRAIARFYIKEHFSSRGERLDQSEMQGTRYYRQFCEKHKHRGDCGRSDSDINYEVKPL